MHNFNVQQLRAFYALMNIGNVTRAAEHLCLTQPSVSRQLQLFENSLGFRVFDRKSGGRLVATSEGQQLYEELESTLRTIENLPEIASGIMEYQSRRLRIAATMPLLNADFLIDAIGQHRKQHPGTALHLERCRRENIEAFVARGDAEIGLCSLPLSNPGVTPTKIIELETVAVVPADHELAAREWLTENDIPPEDLILTTAQVLRRQFTSNATAPTAAPEPPLRVHIALTGLCLAAAGQGIVVCDQMTAHAFKNDRVRLVPWLPATKIEYCLFTAKDNEKTKFLDDFCALLKDVAGAWKARVIDAET